MDRDQNCPVHKSNILSANLTCAGMISLGPPRPALSERQLGLLRRDGGMRRAEPDGAMLDGTGESSRNAAPFKLLPPNQVGYPPDRGYKEDGREPVR